MHLKHSRILQRGIRLVACATVGLWLSGSGSAQQPPELRGLAATGQAPAYLALGDSYPYGSDGSGFLPNNDNFWTGYAEILSQMLDRPLVNAGCAGETTTSFLTGAELDSPRCRETKDAGLLHVDYTGSQMQFVEDYLATHSRVVAMTLQLGGNDFQNFARGCRGNFTCIMAGLPALEETIAENMDTILSSIRSAGYAGPIVFVEYPAANFNNPSAQLQLHIYQSLEPVRLEHGVDVAPVFERFLAATLPFGGNSCAAGLLITNADGTCNIHPTPAGHQLIASIIAEVLGEIDAPAAK